MKLCIIASGNFFSTYGGGQVYVKNLVDEFICQGVDVTIISVHTSFRTPCTLKEYHGVPLFEVEPLYDLRSLIEEINPTIVHAHGEKSRVASVCAALGIPCVITAHHGGILCPAGTLLNHKDAICNTTACHKHCLPCYLKTIRTGIYWYPLLRHWTPSKYIHTGQFLKRHRFIPFLSPIGQAALAIHNRLEHWNTIKENATSIIAPSNAMRDSMALNGADVRKITVIPHGIPLPSSCFHADQQPITFFYVGRITRVKGIHVMLNAFAKMKGCNAELHIIGDAATKSEKRYKKALAKKYKSNSNIVWHGKINDPKRLFLLTSSYDCLLHPAIYLEVFGLNIAEALSLNKYVIATRCGGAEMQITDGVNGTLIAPNDASAMAEAMRNYIASPIRPTSNSVISIEEHATTLIQHYKSLI